MIRDEVKKALVIKLCCLGDIVQTTPSLRALNNAGVEVHFLCIEWVAELLDLIPYVKKKFVMNPRNVFSIASTVSKLRAERYDLIVNFHRNRMAYRFASLLGATYRAGFSWKGQGYKLTDPFAFDKTLHEGLRYLSIVEGVGFERDGVHTHLRAAAVEDKRYEIKKDRKNIGLFPGGGKNPGLVLTTKRWALGSYTELESLLESEGFEVHFFGGELDRDLLEDIKGNMPKTNIIITKNLKEFSYYASRMDAFVAGDTGPLHIASALGVNTVGLFGPSSPDLVGPNGKNTLNLWKRIDCSPCYEPGTVHSKEFLKCRDNICMKEISAAEVKDAIIAILERGES